MTDSPKSEADAPKGGGITVTDPANAPVIYFEGSPAFGSNNGVINVTLAVTRHLLGSSGLESDIIAAAHLRCTVAAAQGLISALQDALLLAQKPSGGSH